MKKILISVLCIVLIILISITFYLAFPLDYKFNYTESINYNNLNYENIGNFKVLTLKGSNYEQGFYHGAVLKDEIKFIVDFMDSKINSNGYFKNFFNRIYIKFISKQYFKNIPDEYLEEIKGISDGSGIDFYSIFLLNVYDEIYNTLGCTNAAYWKYDDLIHGRNLDYDHAEILWDKSVIFYYINSEDKYNVISVSWPGLIGVLTGMNDAGLSLGSMTSKSVNSSFNSIPTGFLYRKILEKAKFLDEATYILQNNRVSIGNNLLVASKEDFKAFVYEIDCKNVIIRNSETKNISAANHYNFLVNKEDSAYLSSFFREERAFELTNSDYFEKETMISLLRDRLSTEKRYSPIANNWNILSVVFLNNKNSFIVAGNDVVPASHGRFFEIFIDDEDLKVVDTFNVYYSFLDSYNRFYSKHKSYFGDIDGFFNEKKLDELFELYEMGVDFSVEKFYKYKNMIGFLIEINNVKKVEEYLQKLELLLDEINNYVSEYNDYEINISFYNKDDSLVYQYYLLKMRYYKMVDNEEQILYYYNKIIDSDTDQWIKNNADVFKNLKRR